MLRYFALLAFFLSVNALSLADSPLQTSLARAVSESFQKQDCVGAVLVVVQKNEVIHREAYGFRALLPEKVPMTADTIFDLASLTKPVATASCVMLLVEQGKLRLSDTVAKHWSEFAQNGKGTVTVEQCLLHTTGLTADNAEKDYLEGKKLAFERIAALKLEAPAGTRFRYSDVGFLVLGELVERITGTTLDEFAKKHIFDPLMMKDTGYKPNQGMLSRVAPTGNRMLKPIVGEVHDPRAFAIGGVAGHAGLFGTADDLVKFAKMLLNNGERVGVRIFKPETVKLFTEPRPVPGGLRSRGWDVDTGFSTPRGDHLPKGENFGHTGFTGTSIWIDPPSQTVIILLTSRLHPNDKGNVTALRKKVANIVTEGLAKRPKAPVPPSGISPVLCGVDVLQKENFKSLAGRKIGLVTNHTGKAIDGTSTIDLLANAPDVKLVALFSPEHGIRGELDEKVGDSTDTKTGLPVYSLYGERRKPTAETLKGVDTLVYDIQDIGCRFYTYISTLGLIMEAAKEHNLRVVVLDRPNPLGGVVLEGPMRDEGRESFIAYHSLPLRHGLTVGELAKMFNEERQWDVPLEVIKVTGWKRSDLFDRTLLPWRNPSPNMRHLSAALLYPGVGLLETTNISVGRGTERPFEWIGAPWLDGRKLALHLSQQAIPGVRFVPTSRMPSSSVFKGQLCGGVDFMIDDWAKLESVRFGLELASALRITHPEGWSSKNYDRLLVHKPTFEKLIKGDTVNSIESTWKADLGEFEKRRAKFLLYNP
jgi:uncharacterized protein YbbC (DUF1343 family)/CubicO group peptidase (beta-lactamase class C family)